VQQRLTPPDYEPHGVILALSKDDWVGMAATSLRRDESCAVSDMTGVLPGYRGRGISMAMKLLAIGYARSNGMRWLNVSIRKCCGDARTRWDDRTSKLANSGR
jgi:predicted GNAT family acetyltransferase